MNDETKRKLKNVALGVVLLIVCIGCVVGLYFIITEFPEDKSDGEGYIIAGFFCVIAGLGSGVFLYYHVKNMMGKNEEDER
jgi:hypothetical protein